ASSEGAAASPALMNSPTLTAAPGTALGVILGTAAYMSPEQARGKRVDRRADIWAFGCVLFEMLTGERAFAGETVSDTMVAVLTRDPRWTALPTELPPRVRALVERCLRKDPHERLRDIGDARVELAESARELADASQPASSLAAASLGRASRTRRLWPAAGIALLAA